jgi:S1-C subfamily serine protease
MSVSIGDEPPAHDPDISIPTLSLNQPADRNGQTTFASDAACVRLYQSQARRIVRVLTRSSFIEQFEDRGTGFFLTRGGLVAMSEHELFAYRGGIRVKTWDDKMYSADVVLEDKPHDICILSIRDRKAGPFEAVQLGSEWDVFVDSDLFAIGYPCGWNRLFLSAGTLECQCMGGILSGWDNRPVTWVDSQRWTLQARMHCEPGDSGSPVFDTDGRVVGIVEAIRVDRLITIITPVSQLVSDLKFLGVLPSSSPSRRP